MAETETPDLQAFMNSVQATLGDFFAQTQAAIFKAQEGALVAKAEAAKFEAESNRAQLEAALDTQSFKVQAALAVNAANASANSPINVPVTEAGPRIVQNSSVTDFSSFKMPAFIVAAALAVLLLKKFKVF